MRILTRRLVEGHEAVKVARAPLAYLTEPLPCSSVRLASRYVSSLARAGSAFRPGSGRTGEPRIGEPGGGRRPRTYCAARCRSRAASSPSSVRRIGEESLNPFTMQ